MPPTSAPDAFAQLKTCIDPYLVSARTILEAGGGSLRHIDIPSSAKVTVVDISPEQLQNHQTAHTKILGDLHAVDMGKRQPSTPPSSGTSSSTSKTPPSSSTNSAPPSAPGGIIVIAARPPGVVTSDHVAKWTPHWFHVFILKHVFNSRTARPTGLPAIPHRPSLRHRPAKTPSLGPPENAASNSCLLHRVRKHAPRRRCTNNLRALSHSWWDTAIANRKHLHAAPPSTPATTSSSSSNQPS